MKIFPTNNYSFKIIGSEKEALDRLKRRTEQTENLSSKITDKVFLGTIKENHFKLISSDIGKGAFCVLTGQLENEKGEVHVEINKAFRILLSIFLCFPILGFIIQTVKNKFSTIFVLVLILQILMIRFVFIELAFKIFSKQSLNKLINILDIDKLEKK